jgi:hypothetical protein
VRLPPARPTPEVSSFPRPNSGDILIRRALLDFGKGRKIGRVFSFAVLHRNRTGVRVCFLDWLTLMFDALQDRLQKVFKTLRIQGVLNDEVVDQTLREVRLALLDADVNLNVVKELLDRVRVKALGEEVRASLSPVQEVIRIVRDELIRDPGSRSLAADFFEGLPHGLPHGRPSGLRQDHHIRQIGALAGRTQAPPDVGFDGRLPARRAGAVGGDRQSRPDSDFCGRRASIRPSNWPWPRARMPPTAVTTC